MLTCVSLGEVFGRREDKSRETGKEVVRTEIKDAAFWGLGVRAANQEESLGKETYVQRNYEISIDSVMARTCLSNFKLSL